MALAIAVAAGDEVSATTFVVVVVVVSVVGVEAGCFEHAENNSVAPATELKRRPDCLSFCISLSYI